MKIGELLKRLKVANQQEDIYVRLEEPGDNGETDYFGIDELIIDQDDQSIYLTLQSRVNKI